MDSDQQQRVVEEVFKGGVGVISSLSEQAAKGINDPKAIQITRSVTDALKQSNETVKKGAEIGEFILGGGAATAIASVTGSTGALATISAAVVPFLPAAVIIGGTGLGIYGLYKACEWFSDN